MLDDAQSTAIKALVNKSLDKAERIWGKHGMALDESLIARADSVEKREVVTSRIPHHPLVIAGGEQRATFIALVADMRQSTQHLNSAISGADASELERVFYETSALLPALDQTIQYASGSVTEYLGDGVLALFHADEAAKEDSIYSAYDAAYNCLHDTREIVNGALKARYRLPPLDIGIGLSMSKAVISLAGIDGKSHPKVYGRCVFKATKLSSGMNEIVVDEELNAAWPTSKGGTLRFAATKRRGVDGFILSSKAR